MEDWQMEDTLPRKVVVTPTLIIPVVMVKRRRRKDHRYRWTFIGIIAMWFLLLALCVFLAWAVLAYAMY
jgi:hypothetical protein